MYSSTLKISVHFGQVSLSPVPAIMLNFRAETGKKGEERPEQQAQDSGLEEEKQGRSTSKEA
jgi:hypothetical protein